MLKFLFLTFFTLFFVGCSSTEESSSSENQTKYLSIYKAPINYEVPIFQKLVLEFNAELNVSSITDTSVYIEDANNTMVGLYRGIAIDTNKTKIIFTPFEYLKPLSTYTMYVTTDVKSVSGLSLSQDFNSTFSTANDLVDDSNLTFETFKPSKNVKVNTLTDISIQFSKNISDKPLYDGSLLDGSSLIEVKNSQGVLVSGTINFFNSIVTFIPNTPLDLNDTYTVSLVGSISDMYGNIYNGNTQWSFATEITTPPINLGYKQLDTFGLTKPATIIRAMETRNGASVIAAATQSGVDFFDVGLLSNGTPTMSTKYSVSIPSQINTIQECDKQYLMVGTMSDGIYILELNETIVTQHSHLPTTQNNAVSGITCAKDSNNSTDMIYAVGPKLGMDIFRLDNDTISFVKNITATDWVPLKVLSSLYYSSYAPYNILRRVYVSDYTSGVRIYDENGTSIRNVDLNGSTKGLAILDVEGFSYLLATNSIGTAQGMDLDGNISNFINFDVLSSASDISIYKEEFSTGGPFKVYVTDPNKGVMVFDVGYNGMTEESFISTPAKRIISTAVIKDTSLDLLATLNEGSIDLYNALSDIYAPTYYSIPSNGGFMNIDGNITITFSEYLNPTTIDANSFLIEGYFGGTVTFTLLPSSDAKVFILKPDANLSFGDYNLTIKGNITDRIGNFFNDGNDSVMTFNAGI